MSGIEGKRCMNWCLVCKNTSRLEEAKLTFFTDAAFEKLRKALDLEMKVSARNSTG